MENVESIPVTDFLERDHRRLDVLFEQVKRSMGSGLVAGSGEPFGAFSSGLRRHMDCEEALLFPLFEPKGKAVQGKMTFTLRAEHQELLRLLEEMDDALAEQRADLFVRLAEELEGTLAQHNQREEGRFYLEVDAQSDEGERNELVSKIRAAL